MKTWPLGSKKDKKTLGTGAPDAAPGSVGYAQFWRVDIQHAVKTLERSPQTLTRCIETARVHPTWQLLTDGNGKPFASFDAFCLEPAPHGLGTDPKFIREALALAHGKVQALTMTAPELGAVGAPKGSKNNPSGIGRDLFAREELGREHPNGNDVTISHVDRGNSAEYKTARVKRAALDGNPAAQAALDAASRGEVKSAAELERLAGIAPPPLTQEQKVARAVRKAAPAERVTVAMRAIETLSDEERSQLAEAGRARGWWT